MGKSKQLIKFETKTCSPCKAMSPILKELEQKYKNIEFIKIDVEENALVAREYNIRNVPTLIYLRNNNIIEQSVGSVSKEEIEMNLRGL